MTDAATTVLLVEDNPIVREGLAEVLRCEGYDVASAEHGQDALAYLDENRPPALILLDMLLPVMDGWRFLERLGRNWVEPKPPVLVVTGSQVIGPEWAEAHGCAGFLRKPVEPERLVAEVRRCLQDS
jgi:CheY-like chemotaxis protein